MGFIPGRDINDNTICFLHIVNYCQTTKTPAIALALDIEKAFDSIEISYLESVLKNMECGLLFLNIFKAIYSNPVARITLHYLRLVFLRIQ